MWSAAAAAAAFHTPRTRTARRLSYSTAPISTPGMLQVRRFFHDGQAAGDMIYNELLGTPGTTMIDPFDLTRRKSFAAAEWEDLLVPIFRGGARVYDPPPLEAIRARRERDLARFHDGIKRFDNPHRYPVGLESALFDLKTRMTLEARQRS